MKARELQNLGFPRGDAMQQAVQATAEAAAAGLDRAAIRSAMAALAKDPAGFRDHPTFGAVAAALLAARDAQAGFVPRNAPARYRQWGEDCEAEAVTQKISACRRECTSPSSAIAAAAGRAARWRPITAGPPCSGTPNSLG
jgi:tRNA-splicing ligase RtcB